MVKKIKKNNEETKSTKNKLENLESWIKYCPEKNYLEWKPAGHQILFADLCQILTEISSTSRRSGICSILVCFFKSVLRLQKDDFIPLVSLVANEVFNCFDNRELRIGDSSIIKTLIEVSNRSSKYVKNIFSQKGDLGLTAEICKRGIRTIGKTSCLTIKELIKKIHSLADAQGSLSNASRVQTLNQIIVKCSPVESKFAVKIIQNKLRIGLAQKTVFMAISIALCLNFGVSCREKINEVIKRFKTGFYLRPELPVIIEYFMKTLSSKKESTRIPENDSFRLIQVGCPIFPMLAEPSKSFQEVEERYQKHSVFAEEKYDGERAQIHFCKGKVHIFSRNGENSTEKWPEIVQMLEKTAKIQQCTSFILDSEIVALNAERTKLSSFQNLSKRKKKPSKNERSQIEIAAFVFDLLYMNEESLLSIPLSSRREKLQELFAHLFSLHAISDTENRLGLFNLAKSEVIENLQLESENHKLAECMDSAVQNGSEGLILKPAEGEISHYIPGKRYKLWRKLKKDYLSSSGDTFDLVLMGAFKGKGRRTGGFGCFLVGSYDEKRGNVESVCKVGTGFSDEFLAEFTRQFTEKSLSQKPARYLVSSELKVDVWFDENVVWEVSAADITESPVHKCASLILAEKGRDYGIGLRFPRFLRVRGDKKIEESTSSKRILESYKDQYSVKDK